MTCPNCGGDSRPRSTYCSDRCAIGYESAKHAHIRLDTGGERVEDATGLVQRWLRRFGSGSVDVVERRTK